MRVLLLLSAAVFAGCQLDESIIWACESDGTCPAGLECIERRCVNADGGAPTAGGATAGGSTAGGPTAGGASGGSAGGSICVPTPCAECGYFDAGCGAEVYCGGCAGPQECGVTRANRCDEPRVCTPEGWCWEHPLPQGNDITALFALGPRQVYLATNGGTVLSWNGEHTSGTSFPTVNVGLQAIHGTAANDLYVVGANRIYRFDGTAWAQEPIPVSVTSGLSVVHAAGGRAWAGGRNGVVLARQNDASWSQLVLSPSSNSEVISLETVGNTLVAMLLDGSVYVMRVDNVQLNRVSSGPSFQDVNAALLALDGGVLVAVGNSGGTSTRVASFEFTKPDAGWRQQLAHPINNTPRAATVLGDQLIIVGATGTVLTLPVDASGVAPTQLVRASRGIQAVVRASDTEVLHGGSGGQFGSIRANAGTLTYQDNMQSVPALDDINDGCALATSSGPRLVVTSDRNRFAERTSVRWSFTDGPASSNRHQWAKCHFSSPTEVWAIASSALDGGLVVGVANRRGAGAWAVVDVGVSTAKWRWVTGFPGGPTYFVPEPPPTGNPVVVNFDGGLGVQDFARLAVDAGVNALVAVSQQGSPNLYGVGDLFSFNTNVPLTVADFNSVARPLTAITGGAFDGGVWSVAVGQTGAVLDRRTGTLPRPSTIGSQTFVDVWAAATFEAYLLSSSSPQVAIRGTGPDAGVRWEELPIRRARGIFGLDTATGHQVWVTGPEGAILRRDSR